MSKDFADEKRVTPGTFHHNRRKPRRHRMPGDRRRQSLHVGGCQPAQREPRDRLIAAEVGENLREWMRTPQLAVTVRPYDTQSRRSR